MPKGIIFREFPNLFRFGRAYYNQIRLLTTPRFWTEKEAASHLGVTPGAFREGVRTGIYPPPVRFGKQTKRWIMSEIIAISGIYETNFTERRTYHELQMAKKEKNNV